MRCKAPIVKKQLLHALQRHLWLLSECIHWRFDVEDAVPTSAPPRLILSAPHSLALISAGARAEASRGQATHPTAAGQGCNDCGDKPQCNERTPKSNAKSTPSSVAARVPMRCNLPASTPYLQDPVMNLWDHLIGGGKTSHTSSEKRRPKRPQVKVVVGGQEHHVFFPNQEHSSVAGEMADVAKLLLNETGYSKRRRTPSENPTSFYICPNSNCLHDKPYVQIVRDQLQAFFKGTVQDDRCAALMQTALKNAADGPPSRHTGRPPSSGQSSNVSETNIVDNATVVLPTLALLPEWAIQHFAARRMHLLDSPMDGNCLFYAFCILHGLCPDDAHADLRKKCVAFVAANWQHYKTHDVRHPRSLCCFDGKARYPSQRY